MNNLAKAQRQRLIRAHRIDLAENVYRADFAPKTDPQLNAPPVHRPLPIILDAAGGAFVLFVLVGAALSLLFLPGGWR